MTIHDAIHRPTAVTAITNSELTNTTPYERSRGRAAV